MPTAKQPCEEARDQNLRSPDANQFGEVMSMFSIDCESSEPLAGLGTTFDPITPDTPTRIISHPASQEPQRTRQAPYLQQTAGRSHGAAAEVSKESLIASRRERGATLPPPLEARSVNYVATLHEPSLPTAETPSRVVGINYDLFDSFGSLEVPLGETAQPPNPPTAQKSKIATKKNYHEAGNHNENRNRPAPRAGRQQHSGTHHDHRIEYSAPQVQTSHLSPQLDVRNALAVEAEWHTATQELDSYMPYQSGNSFISSQPITSTRHIEALPLQYRAASSAVISDAPSAMQLQMSQGQGNFGVYQGLRPNFHSLPPQFHAQNQPVPLVHSIPSNIQGDVYIYPMPYPAYPTYPAYPAYPASIQSRYAQNAPYSDVPYQRYPPSCAPFIPAASDISWLRSNQMPRSQHGPQPTYFPHHHGPSQADYPAENDPIVAPSDSHLKGLAKLARPAPPLRAIVKRSRGNSQYSAGQSENVRPVRQAAFAGEILDLHNDLLSQNLVRYASMSSVSSFNTDNNAESLPENSTFLSGEAIPRRRSSEDTTSLSLRYSSPTSSNLRASESTTNTSPFMVPNDVQSDVEPLNFNMRVKCRVHKVLAGTKPRSNGLFSMRALSRMYRQQLLVDDPKLIQQAGLIPSPRLGRRQNLTPLEEEALHRPYLFFYRAPVRPICTPDGCDSWLIDLAVVCIDQRRVRDLLQRGHIQGAVKEWSDTKDTTRQLILVLILRLVVSTQHHSVSDYLYPHATVIYQFLVGMLALRCHPRDLTAGNSVRDSRMRALIETLSFAAHSRPHISFNSPSATSVYEAHAHLVFDTYYGQDLYSKEVLSKMKPILREKLRFMTIADIAAGALVDLMINRNAAIGSASAFCEIFSSHYGAKLVRSYINDRPLNQTTLQLRLRLLQAPSVAVEIWPSEGHASSCGLFDAYPVAWRSLSEFMRGKAVPPTVAVDAAELLQAMLRWPQRTEPRFLNFLKFMQKPERVIQVAKFALSGRDDVPVLYDLCWSILHLVSFRFPRCFSIFLELILIYYERSTGLKLPARSYEWHSKFWRRIMPTLGAATSSFKSGTLSPQTTCSLSSMDQRMVKMKRSSSVPASRALGSDSVASEEERTLSPCRRPPLLSRHSFELESAGIEDIAIKSERGPVQVVSTIESNKWVPKWRVKQGRHWSTSIPKHSNQIGKSKRKRRPVKISSAYSHDMIQEQSARFQAYKAARGVRKDCHKEAVDEWYTSYISELHGALPDWRKSETPISSRLIGHLAHFVGVTCLQLQPRMPLCQLKIVAKILLEVEIAPTTEIAAQRYFIGTRLWFLSHPHLFESGVNLREYNKQLSHIEEERSRWRTRLLLTILTSKPYFSVDGWHPENLPPQLEAAEASKRKQGRGRRRPRQGQIQAEPGRSSRNSSTISTFARRIRAFWADVDNKPPEKNAARRLVRSMITSKRCRQGNLDFIKDDIHQAEFENAVSIVASICPQDRIHCQSTAAPVSSPRPTRIWDQCNFASTSSPNELTDFEPNAEGCGSSPPDMSVEVSGYVSEMKYIKHMMSSSTEAVNSHLNEKVELELMSSPPNSVAMREWATENISLNGAENDLY